MLSREPISPAALLAEVAAPELGGTCLFLGTVRDGPDDGGITGIEYSAYEAMAVAELERILAEARQQWPDARVAVRHRLGLVTTEEASIGIAAAAPHREAAFAAPGTPGGCCCSGFGRWNWAMFSIMSKCTWPR